MGGHRQAILQGQDSSTATIIAASLAAKAGLTGWGDSLGGFHPEAIWGCVGHDAWEQPLIKAAVDGMGLSYRFKGRTMLNPPTGFQD